MGLVKKLVLPEIFGKLYLPKYHTRSLVPSVQKTAIWDKIFKNGPSKICGGQPLKKLKGYGLLKLCIIHCLMQKARANLVV